VDESLIRRIFKNINNFVLFEIPMMGKLIGYCSYKNTKIAIEKWEFVNLEL